jgi:hypothetical protein
MRIRPAEFEERAYEAPLYNQLERGERNVFSPGQVLEGDIGFDHALFVAEQAVWEILGYNAAPPGIALGYHSWPGWWIGRAQAPRLPRFRLNLFIQAKRPYYHPKAPSGLKAFPQIVGPTWSFQVTPHQQVLLEALAAKARGRAHVAYASPAFHMWSDLYRHTAAGSIVSNSTFPTATALAGHSRWYYSQPGAAGVANSNPESISDIPLLTIIRELNAPGRFSESEAFPQDTEPFQQLASDVIATLREVEPDARSARLLDDLLVLNRLIEPYALPDISVAYAQIRLFTMRYALVWLITSRLA